MDYNNQDIIIARATPLGSSALAVIRLSGLDLSGLLNKITNKKKIKPRYAYTVQLRSPDTGNIQDTCILTYYQNNKSYTGEDIIEISCHGGDQIADTIIKDFVSFGIRIAYPGEFSYRAFKNNKIDLMQAESIAAKISHNNKKYGEALQSLENGVVSEKIEQLKTKIVHIMSIIEHELDFNEEEITHISTQEITRAFQEINQEMVLVLKLSKKLIRLNRGYKIAIVGWPNVGKSTLFNKILGANRAIVTPIKGTTRDVLEGFIKIDGVPLTLYDTAGYRQTKSTIETIGIKKAQETMVESDILLVLDDINPHKTLNILQNKNALLASKQAILIKTKCDAIKSSSSKQPIKVSMKKDVGINAVLRVLLDIIDVKVDKFAFENIVLCNARQIRLFEDAQKIINKIIEYLGSGVEMDIVASECQNFINIMEEIIGKITSTKILNNIFKGFCVGK